MGRCFRRRRWLLKKGGEVLKNPVEILNRVFRYAGGHYGANRNSGREISSSGPEMCTPLFLRPKFHYAGDHYATVQIDILGAKFQILGPRCAPHYFSGPSQNQLGAKNQFA